MDNKNHFTVVLPLGDTGQAMLRNESDLTDLRAMLWRHRKWSWQIGTCGYAVEAG